MKLKICGMRSEQNILDVAALRPEYMGFIFYPGSPRYVGESFVVPESLKSVKRVGVFVNATTEEMLEQAAEHKLEYVQLHGHEPAQQCDVLKCNNMKIIKVFAVDDETDFKVTEPYREVSDFFLFDTKGKHYGGNAKVFNWDRLKRYDQQVPFFLSGGIGADNIEQVKALTDMNIHAVDVNSGVERHPGLKDISRIVRLKEILNTKF